MNKIYKVIWSKVKHQYVVVSELAHSNGKQSRTAKRSLRSRIAAFVVCGAIAAFGVYGALPTEQVFAAEGTNAVPGQYIAVLQVTTDTRNILPSEYTNPNSDKFQNDYQWNAEESRWIKCNDTRTFDGIDGQSYDYELKTADDGSKYWVRKGYSIEILTGDEYKNFPKADKGVIINAYKDSEDTDDSGLLQSYQTQTSTGKITTQTGYNIQDSNTGVYAGAVNGGVVTKDWYGYNIDLDNSGNYSTRVSTDMNKDSIVDSDGGNFETYFRPVTLDNGVYKYNGQVVPTNNMYVVDGELGVFINPNATDPEHEIYTGEVYGDNNEVLMTAVDGDKFYSYWGARLEDPRATIGTMTVDQYNTDRQELKNDVKGVHGDDIEKITSEKTNNGNGGSINFIKNGHWNGTEYVDEYVDKDGNLVTGAKDGGGITITSIGGTGNEDVKIQFQADNSQAFTVDAGSKVIGKVINTEGKEVSAGTKYEGETLTGLEINGVEYALSQGKTYTGGNGITVNNENNTVTVNAGDGLTFTEDPTESGTKALKVSNGQGIIVDSNGVSVNLANNGDNNISGLHFNATGQLANNLKVTDYDNPTVTDNGTKINNDGGNWTITETDGKGLSRELTNTTLDTNASVGWNTGTDSLITGATIAGNASVTDATTEYGRNYKVIDTDGNAVELNDVASASKLRDVADSANSAQTEAQKHTSVSADKNISVTKDTDPNEDGGANYKVSLKDNITLGEGNNQIQINGAPEGNEPAISVGQDTFTVGHDGSIQSTVAIDGMFTDTKDTFKFDKTGATFTKETTTGKDITKITKTSTNINGGTVTIRNDETGNNQTIISGKTITAGDIKFNGEENQATMTGLTNTTWDGTTNNESRAATEGQLSVLDKFAVKYDKDKEDPTKPDYTSVSLGYKDEDGIQHNTQIHNVADGTEDNDAVNLSQLKDYQTTAVGDKNITVENTVTDPNDPTKAYQVSLNPNLDVTSVTTGNSVMNTDGFTTGKDNMKTTINSGKIIVESDTGIYDKTIIDGDTVKVGTIEINSHKWQYGTINGLANVEWNGSTNTPNRAATEGQLQQATSDLSTEIGNLDDFAVKYDKDKKDPTKPDYTSVSLGYTDEDDVQHNTQIHNVADGTADNDAVNLSQLKDYQTTVAEGKNITVENTVTDPKDPTKAYQVSLKDDITLGNLEDNYVQLTGSKGTMQVSNGNGITNIDGSTVTISNTKTGEAIVISDNGTDRTMSGLSNTTWSKDLAGQVAGSEELKSVAATQGQLQSAIQLADQDAKANDYRLVKAETDDGAYTIDNDGSVSLKVASENDKTGTTVTIKDVAKASELKDLSNLAVQYDSKDKTSVTLGGLTADGEAATEPVKLSNVANGVADNDAVNVSQLNAVKTEAKKHTTMTVNGGVDAPDDKTSYTDGNLQLKETTGLYGETRYDVKLNDTLMLGTKDETPNNNVIIDGNNGSILVNAEGANGNENSIEIDAASGTITGLKNGLSDNNWKSFMSENSTVEDTQAATEADLRVVAQHSVQYGINDDGTVNTNIVKLAGDKYEYNAKNPVDSNGTMLTNVAYATTDKKDTAHYDGSAAVNVDLLNDTAENLSSDIGKVDDFAVKYDKNKDGTPNYGSVSLNGYTDEASVQHGTQIHNVANGTDKNDAVNLGQLETYSAKATTTVSEGDNITVTSKENTNGSMDYTVSLKPDVTLDAKDKDGNTIKDGNSIELSGTNGTINAVNSDTNITGLLETTTTKNEFNFDNGGSFVTEETKIGLISGINTTKHEAEFNKDGAIFTKTEYGLPSKYETSTTKIDGGTITISYKTKEDNNKIVIDGKDGEMSGLSNIAWDEDTKKAVELDKEGTGAATIAATQGQLSDAIKEAGKDAAKNDFYLQNGTTMLKDKNGNQITVSGQNTGYKADEDGNIDMTVANENGDKKHVVITDVASKEVLDKVKADVDTGWFAADSTTPADDENGNFAVKPGDTVKFNGDDNITVTANDNAVNVGLEDNILLGTENGQHIQFNGAPEDENANMISITDKTGNDVFVVKQDGTISSDNDVIADADGEKYSLLEIGDNTKHIEHYAADDEGNAEGKDYTQVEGTKLYNDGSISSTVEDSLGMSSDTLTFDENGLTVSKDTMGNGSGSTNISGDTITATDEYNHKTTIDGGSVTTEDLTVNAENDNKLTFNGNGLNVNSGDTGLNVSKDGISLSVDNGEGNNSSLKVTKDGTEFSYSESGVSGATTTTIKGGTITTDTVTGLNNTKWDDATKQSVAADTNRTGAASMAATQGQLAEAIQEAGESAAANDYRLVQNGTTPDGKEVPYEIENDQVKLKVANSVGDDYTVTIDDVAKASELDTLTSQVDSGWTAKDGEGNAVEVNKENGHILNFYGDENINVTAASGAINIGLNPIVTLGNKDGSYIELNSLAKDDDTMLSIVGPKDLETGKNGIFTVGANGTVYSNSNILAEGDVVSSKGSLEYSLNDIGNTVSHMTHVDTGEYAGNNHHYTVIGYNDENNPIGEGFSLAVREDGAVAVGGKDGIKLNETPGAITGLTNTEWSAETGTESDTAAKTAATQGQLNDLYNAVVGYDIEDDGKTVNYGSITLGGDNYDSATHKGGTVITNVAYSSGNGSDAVNVDYLNDAIADAVSDTGEGGQGGIIANSDKHLVANPNASDGVYKPNDKGNVDLIVADKNGNKETVTIGDVASKTELDSVQSQVTQNTSDIAGIKEDIGDLNYSNAVGTDVKDGDSVTDAIGKLDNKIDSIGGTATEADNNTVTGGTIKDDGTISLTQKDGGTVDFDKKVSDAYVSGAKFENNTLTISQTDKYGNDKYKDIIVNDIASTADISKVETGYKEADKNITDTIGATSKEDLTTIYKDADKDGNTTTQYISQEGVGNMAQADVALDHAIQNVANTSYANDMYLNNRINNVESRLSDVEERIDKVGAMAAAIANLRTMGYDPEAPTEIAVGVGQYKSETGLALGIFHYPNQDFMLSASISTSGDEVMGGIGATWKLGRKSAAEREKDNEEKILAKAEEIKQAAKRAEVKAQAERHAQLLAEREAEGQPIRPVEEA